MVEKNDQRKIVRERYGKIASEGSSCCGPSVSCCGGESAKEISGAMGYSQEDMDKVPEGSNLGLGCGNPLAFSSIKEGDTVLDLGSGAGFDCFLASERVGSDGKVIGVDMTSEMLASARKKAEDGGYGNVEFRLGEIEHLPVGDATVDLIISNCVINLSPEKSQVFREAFRTLKPGGQLMVSDIVLLRDLPDIVRNSINAFVGCVAGASLREEYLGHIKRAGFTDIRILEETGIPSSIVHSLPDAVNIARDLDLTPEQLDDMAKGVVSVKVSARKPGE